MGEIEIRKSIMSAEGARQSYPLGKDVGDLDQSGHRGDEKQSDELKRF